MANCLLLDQTAWDLVLDASGNIACASDPYAIAQNVATAIRTFIGDCWFNTALGVPHWSILGRLPPLALVRHEIEKAASSVRGVAEVKTVFVELTDRRLKGSVQFIDETGQAQGVTF